MNSERDYDFNYFNARPLDPNSSVTLFQQAADRIRASINDGILRPGDPLPSEHQLTRALAISRPTVRRAMEILVDEGLLTKRQGMGTFVSKLKLEQPTGRVIGFSERMHRNGMTPSNRILEHRIIDSSQADSAVVRHLHLIEDQPVIRLVRLRLADDEPIVLETAHLSLNRFPDLDEYVVDNMSLYDVLWEHYGVEIAYLKESLEPVVLGHHEAALLNSQSGTAGMLAHIRTSDRDNIPVEHSVSLVRGDRCQYEIDILAPDNLAPGGSWHIQQTQLEIITPTVVPKPTRGVQLSLDY